MRFIWGLVVLAVGVLPFGSYGQEKAEAARSSKLTFKLKGPGIEKKSALDKTKIALISGGVTILTVGAYLIVRSLAGGEELPPPPPPPD